MKYIVVGLVILMKYQPDGETCAVHDKLLACPALKPSMLSSEDLACLEANRWHWDCSEDVWYIYP